MIRFRYLLGALGAIALVLLAVPAEADAPGSEVRWVIDPSTGVVTATNLRGCGAAEATVTIFVDATQSNGRETTAVASAERLVPCAGETPNDVRIELGDGVGKFHPGPASLSIGIVSCYYDDASQTTTTCIGGSGTFDGRLTPAN